MKILHTSDWHIGRSLNEQSLLADQAFVLEELLELIRLENPDVVIVAGDIYDRSVPSKEALALVDHIFGELILELGIPILVIGGNHDGRERLAYNAGILESRGLHIWGNAQASPEPLVLEDAWGRVAFWPVPFVRPVEYRHLVKTAEVEDYAEMYRAISQEIAARMHPEDRNVLISHGLFLKGPEAIDTIDDSVRPLEIGGVSYADAADFDAFDYVALGHLHRPQKVLRETVRYSGSLLKYAFSEVHQHKSVTMVELGEKGKLHITQRPLKHKRDLRILQGSFESLTAPACYEQAGNEDYLKVVLEDDKQLLNPMEKLRKIYPNILEMTYLKRGGEERSITREQIKERLTDPLRLFEDFHQYINGRPLDEDERAAVQQVLAELEAKACDH